MTPTSKQWAQTLVNLLKDGGTWVFPRTMTLWRVNKPARILTLTHRVGTVHPKEIADLRQCFAGIGWTIALAETVKVVSPLEFAVEIAR